jgi:hypothetical protein
MGGVIKPIYAHEEIINFFLWKVADLKNRTIDKQTLGWNLWMFRLDRSSVSTVRNSSPMSSDLAEDIPAQNATAHLP